MKEWSQQQLKKLWQQQTKEKTHMYCSLCYEAKEIIVPLECTKGHKITIDLRGQFWKE